MGHHLMHQLTKRHTFTARWIVGWSVLSCNRLSSLVENVCYLNVFFDLQSEVMVNLYQRKVKKFKPESGTYRGFRLKWVLKHSCFTESPFPIIDLAPFRTASTVSPSSTFNLV
jgi:hypothetical protein